MRGTSALLVSVFFSLSAGEVSASPSSDDNAGRWSDTYNDDDGLAEATNTKLDVAGRRIVLSPGASEGTFLTSPISPASFTAWGALYVDYTAASDASVELWVVAGTLVYGNGATGTRDALPAPLALGPSDKAGYAGRASLVGVPVSAAPLQVLVRLRGQTIAPAVNALELTWTPRSIVSLRLEAPATVRSAETIGVRLNVAVSFVDAKDLIVAADLPAVQPNLAAALQDQRAGFVSATNGGVLSPDGAKVIWNLGTRKAGETFTLVYTSRTNMGLLDQIDYRTSASATPSNGQVGTAAPQTTRIISAPAPLVERPYGSGIFVINGQPYAFPDSTIEVVVQGWNYRSYPGNGGETLFDSVVWDDASAFVNPIDGLPPSGGPFDISNNGVYTGSTPKTLPNGTVIPAKAVYWLPGHMTVGQSFSYRYKVKLGKLKSDGGPFARGQVLRDCATLESDFITQLNDLSGPVCRDIKIDEPFEPNGIFAKGEEIRGYKQVGAGEDLISPVQIKAAFGETMSYFLLTYNSGVSRLDDIVMIDKIPDGFRFEDASLPPEAAGTVWYYTAADGASAPRNAPPAVLANGGFGAGWSQTLLPEEREDVSWVAFRVPKLSSVYFPDTDPSDGTTPISAEGEVVVTVKPPDGDCPTVDITLENLGLFRVYSYTPPNKPTQLIPNGPLAYENLEHTVVVPDLPSLVGSVLSDSPATAVATQPLVYTLNIRNSSPPGTSIPLDDAEQVKVKVEIPSVQANGIPTPLLVDAISAPGGSIAYNLPASFTVTYPAAIAPNDGRVVTLTTRLPPGVIDGTSFSIAASLDWRDDLCGAGSHRLTESTSFFGLPSLEVTKTADFAYGQTGTQIIYALDYVNAAQSPSTKTWIVDRIPPGTLLGNAEVPVPNGQVWFSTTLPPTLPPALNPDDPFTDARVRANFQRVLDNNGDGWVEPPTGATYVAFLVDDGALNPPQFITGTRRTVHMDVRVTEPKLGSLIANQAAVLSKELIQAISNKATFTVTGRPGLRVAKQCGQVVATNEELTYTIDYYNDSANSDDNVLLNETLPEGVSIIAVEHVWNQTYLDNHDDPGSPEVDIDGQTVAMNVGPLEPREGGRFLVTIVAANGLSSGTFLVPETFGTATGGDGQTRSGYAACTVLVENADLFVSKLVDNPAPRAGETYQYTIVISNQGAHDALDVVVRDTLPSALEYVPDSVVVTPAPWNILGPKDPVRLGNDLIWSATTGNGLVRGHDPAGTFPGDSGNVSIIFAARVKPTVLPGTTLSNCATVTTATGEDAAFANTSCVPITTPLPDPTVRVTAPPLKKPGEKATWTLNYGNIANEIASGVVVILALPDGPIPGADGVVDVRFSGVGAPNGEVVWYHPGPSTGTPPAFNPANPAASGWTQTVPPGGGVSYVAFFAGTLPPLSPTRTVQVSAFFVGPGPNGELVDAGATLTATATIAMTTSGFQDQDPSNNTSSATTRVPGIDLTATKTASPSGRFPGVEPGNTVIYTLAFVNSGTVPAFGIQVTDVLPPEVELAAAPEGVVALVDADGQPVGPINRQGQRVSTAVEWSKSGATYQLGDAATNSSNYWDNLGLLPGDRGAIVLTVRVKDTVANQTIVANTMSVATTGTEEITSNNSSTVEVAVYRADPFIIKTVIDGAGEEGVVDVGDALSYVLEYGNSGNFEAADVIIEDAIPAGLDFVIGSVSGIDPSTMDVVYSDDGGVSFDYVPDGRTGEVDPNVTHVRVVWTSGLPAPASGIFAQTTAIDFEAGVHQNTRPDIVLDGVVTTGKNKCDVVECGRVSCEFGSYIPAGECCEVCRPSVGECEKAPVDMGCESGFTCYPLGSCRGSCTLPPETSGLAVVMGRYYVGDRRSDAALTVFDLTPTAHLTPRFQIFTPENGAIYGGAYLPLHDMFVVPNQSLDEIEIWDDFSTLTGDIKPTRIVRGEQTGLFHPEEVEYDAQRDIVYISGGHGVFAYHNPEAMNGDMPPDRDLGIIDDNDQRLALDEAADILYVATPRGKMYRFDNASTVVDWVGLARTWSIMDARYLWGLVYDPQRDILYYGDQTAALVGAIHNITEIPSGELFPDRVIVSATMQGPSDLALLVQQDILYITDSRSDQVLVLENASQAAGEVQFSGSLTGEPDQMVYPGDVELMQTPREVPLWRDVNAQCQEYLRITGSTWLECVSRPPGEDEPADPNARCDKFRCATVDEHGYCVGEVPSAWATCWPSECPEYQSFNCEAQHYWEQCNQSYGATVSMFAQCEAVRLKGGLEGLDTPFDCQWLKPTDTCGRCDASFCAATPDEHRTWEQVHFERPGVGKELTSLYQLYAEFEQPFPADIMPFDNLPACRPAVACADASPSASTCVVECGGLGGKEALCQVCRDGQVCAVCPDTRFEEGREAIGRIDEISIQPRGGCELVAARRNEFYHLCLNITGDNAELCATFAPPSCDIPDTCTGGIYTSPEFPGDGEGNVTRWGHVVIGEAPRSEGADREIRYSVIDASTGQAILGFEGLPYPDDGVIDLSQIDAAQYPKLELRATFSGKSVGRFEEIAAPQGFDECEPDPYIEAWLINEPGQVTGTTYGCMDLPYLWTPESGMTNLFATWNGEPTPNVSSGYPYALDDEGRVAGMMRTGYEEIIDVRAFVWTAELGTTDIGAFEGDSFGDARIVGMVAGALGSGGRVAGMMMLEYTGDEGEVLGRSTVPFVWTQDDGLRIPDAEFARNPFARFQDTAYGMRFVEPGIVIGLLPSYDEGAQMRAYRWNLETDEFEVLDYPLGSVVLVGAAADGTVALRDRFLYGPSLLWTPDGEIELIRFGQGEIEIKGGTVLSGIAADGTIVGHTGGFFGWRAFIRHPGGEFELLPNHPDFPHGVAAAGINDAGDVYVELYQRGSDFRELTSQAAIWDGANYVLVDGYPSDVTSVWTTWYGWDGFKAMNSHRQVIGQVSAPHYNSDYAYRWEPDPDDVLALLDWRVLYETDRNPSVGIQTLVTGVCSDQIVNTATIATRSPEVSTDNNSSTVAIDMNRADLRVDLRASPSVVGPAQNGIYPEVSWFVSVINDGPGIARDVRVAVDLPNGERQELDFGTISTSEPVIDLFVTNTTIYETQPNTEVVGSVELATPTLDCNLGNNSASASVFVGSWPNLFVTADGPPSAVAGDTFEYLFDWGNDGNDDANETILTIVVPPGLTVVDTSIPGEPGAGGTYVIDLGDVPPGTSEELSVTFSTPGCAAISDTAYRVTATIATSGVEVDTSDNQAADQTQILAPAGAFALALVANRGTAQIGDIVTWEAHFRNTGLGQIDPTALQVTLPSGLSYVAGSANAGGALGIGGVLQWQGGALAPAVHGAVQFAVRVDAVPSGPLVATAAGVGACPATATASLGGVRPAGLTIVKGADRDSLCAQPGEDGAVQWTLTVSNTGTTMLPEVVVTDPVPSGMTYVAGTIAGVGADASNAAELRWRIGNMAPGAALSVGYATRVVAGVGGVVTGTSASATSGQATATSAAPGVALVCGPRLVFSKSWTAGCALPGADRQIVLEVRNTDVQPALGVSVGDRIPEVFTFVSASAGGFDASTRRFTADIGALRPGESAAVTINVATNAGAAAGAIYTDTATLLAAGIPPQVSNRVTGAVLVCGDANVCTLDACEPLVGCVNPPVVDGLACDDGDACSLSDICVGGQCGGSERVVCTPLSQCHVAGVCDSETGKCSDPVADRGTGCNDGNACTISDFCENGACANEGPLGCDDDNPCTTDRCDEEVGCVHDNVDDGTGCDDENVCSTTSQCQAGECVGTFYRSCNDENPCTIDGCHPVTGCDFGTLVDDGTACEDEDLCTIETTCNEGVCGGGDAVTCGDDNPCTSERCDSEVGCVVSELEDGTSCDDGVACSSASSCRDGQCTGTAFLACDDDNDCTSDRCDPTEGCVFSAREEGTSCDDGQLCTRDDVCDGEGTCGGIALVCGVPGECELDGACNPDTGVCDFPTKPGDIPLPVTMLDIGPDGGDSAAVAVAGEYVAGWVEGEGGAHRIARWSDGVVSDLGPGEAVGVTEAGQVVAVRPGANSTSEVVWVDGTTKVLWTRGDVDGGVAPVFGPFADGVVAGQALDGAASVPALRLANGNIVKLGSQGAGLVDVVRDADAGWVVGTEEGGVSTVAFRWNGGATRERLALPDGVTTAHAWAVGPAGHIGGDVSFGGSREAVVWRPNGSVVVLPPACLVGAGAPCLEDTSVVAVDGFGGYLGRGRRADDNTVRAFVGVLGEDPIVLEPFGAVTSQPVAIDDGRAIGTWTTAVGATLGFTWTEGDGLVELAAPGLAVTPTDVAGDFVLGSLKSPNLRDRAFLWTPVRGVEDLGSLGGGTSDGLALAVDGRVVGESAKLNGEIHAFVTGVPVNACLACEEDREPPVLVCPVAPGVVECVDGGAVVAVGKPSARDTCSFPVQLSSNFQDVYALGTTDVFFTATDALGNEASCAVSVTVVDTEAPSITCPAPATVNQPTDRCGAEVALTVTTEDVCDAEGVTILSDAPAAFPPGVTKVTFTAVDPSGNRAECETEVTVVDQTPLAIACEENLTVDAPADFCGWPDAIAAVVLDECAADVTVESESDFFPVGESKVTFDASNDRGETASCVTTLTVNDVTAPGVSCGSLVDLAEGDLPRAFAATADDACTAVIVVSELACEKDDGSVSAFTDGCAARVEDDTVVVGEVDAGADFKGTVHVRWKVTATDPSGNVSSADCTTEVKRDRDDDGVLDRDDNCPSDANTDQLDFDEDGVGNVCDIVDDGISALGSGACSGGGGAPSGVMLLLALVGLVWMRRRARA